MPPATQLQGILKIRLQNPGLLDKRYDIVPFFFIVELTFIQWLAIIYIQ